MKKFTVVTTMIWPNLMKLIRGWAFLFLMFVSLCTATQAQASTLWSGIIASSRAVDWSQAGVVGGIPSGSWTQCGPTIAAYTGTAAAINTALANCGPNHYVQLGVGTFNLSTGINISGVNNVALRGEGADQTDLVISGIAPSVCLAASVCISSTDGNWKNGPSNLVNWTATSYAQGTTSITLATVPNLKVGNPIILDQTDNTQDDGSIMVSDSTTTLPYTAPGLPGPYTLQGNGGGSQRTGRQQEQIVTVSSCNGNSTPGFACSGTNVTVTISPGLHMPNWAAANTPQAWWATNPALNDGLENLTVDSTASNAGNTEAVGIEFLNCSNCWVKGVRGIDTNAAQVQLQYTAHTTVRDSYFFLTQSTVTASYGWDCYGGSDDLVENNIFQAITSPIMFDSACSGEVIGYNFSINNFYTASAGYSTNAHGDHTSGNDMSLYEGNYGNIVDADVIHGTHNFNTYFRNRLTGPQPTCWASGSIYATATYEACNNNLDPFAISSFSRFYNIIGNVLGTTGTNSVYINGTNPGANAIYALGYGNSSNGITVPTDPNVQATLMLWGNYDTANAGVRFVSSEVPSALTGTQAPYSNPVPTSQALPASFYYSSQPSWWPATVTWPPIGPDVTGGNITGVAGHANMIPAQNCFLNVMGGPSNGVSSVLTFNANNCYSSTSSGSIGTVDAFITMNGSTVGSALTAANLQTGTIGNSGGGWSTNTVTGMSVGASQATLLGSVTVNGTTFPANYATQSLALNNAYNFNTVKIGIPGSHTAITTAGFITFGPANLGVNGGSLNDNVSLYSTTGSYAVMQLLNGNDGQSGAASYGVNIETDYNSTTTHSTFITVTPGGTYWYSLKADFAAGEAYLNIYSTTGTLVGSTTVQTRATGTAAFIEYGNNEAGTSPGTTTYFGDSLLAYTNPVFPLGPGGSNNVAYGDVNGALNNSGQPVVNINDAEMTAQETIGLNVPNFISANAEVDGTKTVDIYDAFLIAEYAIGLITKFPVQG